jgi:dihydroorotase-like cyclic amidohydrolase
MDPHEQYIDSIWNCNYQPIHGAGKILVEDGKIRGIGSGFTIVEDARWWMLRDDVMPGGVDVHVHLDLPMLAQSPRMITIQA